MLEILLAATAIGQVEPGDVGLSLRSLLTSARVLEAPQRSMGDRRRQLSVAGPNPAKCLA